MLTKHRLSKAEFVSLAGGTGSLEVIASLREAEQSKHLMLVHAIAQHANGADHGTTAFRDGYELLGELQSRGAAAWLLDLPHLGGWAHDCLIALERGAAVDFGHLASIAAAAAVHAGTPFELEVPVRDGRVLLPGLGSFDIPGEMDWIRLRGDGDRVTVGQHFAADRDLLVPDTGSARPVPRWSGTPAARASAGGLTWEVLLETEDRHLDRYPSGFCRPSVAELGRWRHWLQLAWDNLIRYHRWAAEPMARTISAIVPLTSNSETELVSATSPAAFGAIATSWPPDQVALAETLIHEFQHVKLGALMDMEPLVEPSEKLVYTPWRADPRPAHVILQGVYAHLGIVRFWQTQRDVEKDPDAILRAQAQYARWRPTIEPALDDLLEAGCLTPRGERFVRCAQEEILAPVSVPADAQEMAREAALDHWLTWQFRHKAIDAAGAARLAAAYQRGEPGPGQGWPGDWIQAKVRTVDADIRSRLLTLRYLVPARYRELRENQQQLPDRGDRLLIEGKTAEAIQVYRDRIASSATPQPAAWIGLALALNRLPRSPLKHIFVTQLALMCDVHCRLDSQGGLRDPINLAEWLL